MRSVVSTSLSVWMVLFLSVGPTWAEPKLAARADGYVGYAIVEVEQRFNFNEDTLQGGGSGSVSAVFDQLYVQGDVFGDSMDFDSLEAKVVGGGAHAGWRDPERGSLGIVGTINHIDQGSVSTDAWRVGLEGQLFLRRATWGLNAGFLDGNASSNVNGNEDVHVDGSFTFYPTDRIRLQARGGALGVGKTEPTVIAGLNGEILVADFVAPFVRWEGSFQDADLDIFQNSIVAGVRLYWGAETPSLKAYDREHFNDSCIGILQSGRNC